MPATLTNHVDTEPEITELIDQLQSLRSENDRLRGENRQLRVALDAHVARARSTYVWGPVEMTAGTCVGPRRRRRSDPR
jgi:hypothetical protein